MDWTAVFEPVWTATLLPSSATPFEVATDAADANLVARDPVTLIQASRVVEDVPLEWLAWLAEEMSVDEFSSAWPETRRRAVVADSLGLHRVKGTRHALVRALAPLGFTLRVNEWFEAEPTFQPNTFRIAVTIDDDREWIGSRQEIIRVANKAKNAHTRLDAVEVTRLIGPANTYVGALPRRSRIIRVGQMPMLGEIRGPSFVWVGAGQVLRRTIRVGPR